VEEALRVGYWYAEQRQPKCAAEWFQRAATADPERFEAHYNLGVALLKSGAAQQAAAAFGRVLRLKPEDERVRNAWETAQRQALEAVVPAASQRARLGDWQGAADACREFLERSPSSVPARYQLALALSQLGQYQEAEMQLRLALENLPDNPSLLTALGMTLVRQKKASEAVPVFQQVERWSPRSAIARLNTAVALADAAQLDAAAEKLREAIAADPKLFEAHRQLGRVLIQVRRLDEAREANLQALALKSDDVVTLRQLGLVERLSGNHEEAVLWYGRAVAAGATDADTLFRYGKELFEVGKREEAVTQLKNAIERDPANRQALYLLMRALAKQDPEQARQIEARMRAARQAEMAMTRARMLSNAGIQAAQRREWVQALGQLREAVAVCGDCPDRAAMHRNLGLVLVQAGESGEAKRELEQALRLDPNDRDAALALEILRKTSAFSAAGK
jgi:tetratricopeptide (TPR) repeat protein